MTDFEFHQLSGERPQPICMVAREYRTGRTMRVWSDKLVAMPRAPFGTDNLSLFIAYYASAELNCFLALGWPMPERILDLFTEFRCITNGLQTVSGNGLLGAMAHYGLGAIDAAEKTDMRDLAIRGGPFTDDEQSALLSYCETDVVALSKLLPAMVGQIDLPRALFRGRYMAAAARMEYQGVPIDVDTLESFRNHWESIKGRLVREIDSAYGVFATHGSEDKSGIKIWRGGNIGSRGSWGRAILFS